jgi:hypothetical protein
MSGFHRLAVRDDLFSMAVAYSSNVIYITISHKMKSPHHINVIRSTSASRVSLGLIGGVVTAILCSLALLNDMRSTGNEDDHPSLSKFTVFHISPHSSIQNLSQ